MNLLYSLLVIFNSILYSLRSENLEEFFSVDVDGSESDRPDGFSYKLHTREIRICFFLPF